MNAPSWLWSSSSARHCLQGFPKFTIGASKAELMSCEMPLGEGAARSGFEISLELCRQSLIPKLQGDDQRPRFVLGSMGRLPRVVPSESFANIGRQPDVVPLEVVHAPEHIDESFFVRTHTGIRRVLGGNSSRLRSSSFGEASRILVYLAEAHEVSEGRLRSSARQAGSWFT